MKVFEKEIKLASPDKSMRIVPFGDIHLGASGCNIKYLKNTIKCIQNDENMYGIGMGDYIDAIDIKDKRFDIKSVDKQFIPHLDDIAGYQMDMAIKLLEPIQDKILVMIPGNHEDKLRTRYSVDVMKHLTTDLHVDVGDYMTYLRLKFSPNGSHVNTVTMWLHHGWFAGRKMGGKVNQIMDVASGYEFDVGIAGHSHELFATTSEKISLPALGMSPIQTKKIFINSGTFLETTSKYGSSYSEQKAYAPAKIGTARLDIYPMHRPRPDMHVTI